MQIQVQKLLQLQMMPSQTETQTNPLLLPLAQRL
jgi:hypothetical protein